MSAYALLPPHPPSPLPPAPRFCSVPIQNPRPLAAAAAVATAAVAFVDSSGAVDFVDAGDASSAGVRAAGVATLLMLPFYPVAVPPAPAASASRPPLLSF